MTALSFDRWAEWLQTQLVEMSHQGFDCAFKDGRSIPELALNPSYHIEVSAGNRFGYIGFWSNGLCDYEVFDGAQDGAVVSRPMLEANDETMPALFEAFSSALKG